MTESLRGSVIATMRPVDGDQVPAEYGWDFPRPLAVLSAEIRRREHVEMLQLLDVDHQVVATLLLPLPDVGEASS